jgi:hypothetical protein
VTAHGFRNEGGPFVRYGGGAEPHEMDGATFSRTCPTCGRIVKADAEVKFDGQGQPVGNNATCHRCGRVAMPFEGYP